MGRAPSLYGTRSRAPVFSAGSFTGLYDPLPPTSSSGVLTFTIVPELSTWGMMLTGFAGLTAVAAGRRRRPLASRH